MIMCILYIYKCYDLLLLSPSEKKMNQTLGAMRSYFGAKVEKKKKTRRNLVSRDVIFGTSVCFIDVSERA